MSFSTPYLAILDQIKTHVETTWGLTGSKVFHGVPPAEQVDAHAVILIDSINSSLSHPVASGKRPGSTMTVTIRGYMSLDIGSFSQYAYLATFVDPIVALIEGGATYGTYGMMPEVTNVSTEDLTGYVDGTGQANFVVAIECQFQVQRARG